MSLWFSPTVPARVKPIPWLHADATLYLENLLTPDMEILEFGAGGSTLWFAERVKHVTSVEDDPDWYAVLKRRIPQNVTLISGYGVLYVAPVDLLMIDGEPVEQRAAWIASAPRLVKPGGYIVLDNANRPEYSREREALQSHARLIHTVDSNLREKIRTDYLITEFYRRCE